MSELLCFKYSKIIDNKLNEILKNSEVIDKVDIEKILKRQLEKAKKYK